MSILIRNVKVLGSLKTYETPHDVLLDGGTISAIGNLNGKRAEEVIEGGGAYLAPGFIDAQNASDHFLTLLTDPKQEDFIKQGVTTIVGGHDGVSLAPLLYGSLEAIRKWGNPETIHVNWLSLREFFETLSRRPLAVNFATFAGHSTIRRAIIANQIRELTKNELQVMSGVFSKSLEEGALGISYGLASFHTQATPYAELAAFSKIVQEAGRMVAIYPRSPSERQSLKEVVRLNAETGVSIFMSHLLHGNAEDSAHALEEVEALAKERDVHFGTNPFACTIQPIYTFLPEWTRNGDVEAMRKSIEDQWLAKRILQDLPALNPEATFIERSPGIDADGLTLAEYMEISGSTSVEACLLKLMCGTRLQAMLSTKDEHRNESELWSPRSLIVSRSASFGDAWHGHETPLRNRSQKTFTEFLRKAEEKGVLEDAISKITILPAKKFGFAKRGILHEGYLADVTLFETGGNVKTVIVNGKIVVRDGVVTGELPGIILKHT